MDRREAIRLGIVAAGGLASTSSLQLLVSCSDENSMSGQILNPKEIQLTSMLVDHIIPETTTPSASQSGVVPFIDIALAECFPEEDQNLFRDGLTALLESGFNTWKIDQQIEALLSMEKEKSPFFALLKRLTLIGYFTSESGIKENYTYAPVPGRYEGCVPFDGSTKAWRGNNL